MVQDDERSHHRAQAVDVELSLAHATFYVRTRGDFRLTRKRNQYFTIAVKGIRLQARAAHQRSVNLFLPDQRSRVVRLHAAAVQNPHRRSHIRAQQLRHFRANDLVRVDSHLRRRRLAGTDGPHRLVRNHNRRSRFGSNARQRSGNLRLQHVGRLARLALFQHFAHAYHRHHAMLQRRVQLLVHNLVGLGKILPPFRVADQRMRSAYRQQLPNRGLAGVGALFGKVNVLAPTATFDPLAAAITVGSRTGEGNRAISSRVCPATSGKNASTNAFASAGVLNIFQLAAISALRDIFLKFLNANFS